MPDRETRLLHLAAALADAAPVDWDEAESSAASDSERRQIQRLRLIGQLAAATGAGSGNDRTDAEAPAPVIWGPLRVIEKIGRGRFGDVYRAWDPRLDREVALKLLRREDGTDSATIEEGRLLAKVRHPNVVTVYGAERIENRVGLWMELIQGHTLEEVVARGPLAADEALAIGFDVCQALAAVHRAGLLHRDVKAQNVMRDDHARIVLMDFGTGRELDVDAPAELAGTPLYLAPEVLAGAPDSRRSDLYSLGVLLYHLVTGMFPVNGRTLADIRDAHAREPENGAVDRLRHLSDGLRAVIERALSRDPGARFTSALDMADALDRCRGMSRVPREEPSPKVSGGMRRLGAAVLLGGLVLGVVAFWAFWRGSDTRATETGVVIKPVWTGAGVDGSGSPSPDGRYLTFSDWETGNLALRDLRAGTIRRLTNNGGSPGSGDFVAASVVAHDGRWVAYASFVQRPRRFELRVAPIEHTDDLTPRVVLRTDVTDFVAPIGWMPDGRQLAVMRRTNARQELGLASIADGAYRTLTTLETALDQRAASLSPDGRYIAYQAPAAGNDSPHDIFVVSTGGDRPTPVVVVQSPADDVSPLWAPDGSGILFLSDRTGSVSLWMVPLTGDAPTGPAVLLRADTGPITPLGISQAGALYYLLSGATRQDVYVAELHELRASKPPARLTEQFVNSNIGPAWSSDGEYLAYYSLRAAPTLVVRATKTGNERDIALPAGLETPFYSGPKWFPDNRSVLILSRGREDRGPAFYRLWLDTARADLLHRLDSRTPSHTLSSDGRTIYYVAPESNGRANSHRLMRHDIATGQSSLLKKDEWFIAVAISPHGDELAYLKSFRPPGQSDLHSAVEVMPLAGGETREVFRAAPWLSGARYNTLAWTPDGRALMFVRDDGRLWTVDAKGGEPREMGVSMNARIKSPTVHRDGRQIAFGIVEADANEVWVHENVLASTLMKP